MPEDIWNFSWFLRDSPVSQISFPEHFSRLSPPHLSHILLFLIPSIILIKIYNSWLGKVTTVYVCYWSPLYDYKVILSPQQYIWLKKWVIKIVVPRSNLGASKQFGLFYFFLWFSGFHNLISPTFSCHCISHSFINSVSN